MTNYSTYYKGVKINSNIPSDVAQAGNYTYTINWSDNALGWIEDKATEGFAVLNKYSSNIIAKFLAEMSSQDTGANITNVSFTANNQSAQLSFTTHTLNIFSTVGIIIGVIIWGLALATSLIPGVDVLSIGSAIIYTFLDVIGVSALNWFVSSVDAIYTPLAKAVGPAIASGTMLLIGGVIVIGIGLAAYYIHDKM